MAKVMTSEQKRVLLDLSEEEAKALRGVLACVGLNDGNAGRYTNSIRDALCEAGFMYPDIHGPYMASGSVTFINPLPTPEPPPLTLADIKPGEWFRYLENKNTTDLCFMLSGNDHYIFLGQYSSLPILSKNDAPSYVTVVRLTTEEARAWAVEHDLKFPF